MKMGRPPRIPRLTLEPLLRQMREAGATCKLIARELGYHHEYISYLCCTWNIPKQIYRSRVVAYTQPKDDACGDGIRASAVNANTSAVSEAKPDDTRPIGSH